MNGERSGRETILDERRDVDAANSDDAGQLPGPGELVHVGCTLVDAPDQDPPRSLALFPDADGVEVAIEDEPARLARGSAAPPSIRATVLGVVATAEGVRVRVSLAEPDGHALDDGRAEIEVLLDQLLR
jgi:hypothetical protein